MKSEIALEYVRCNLCESDQNEELFIHEGHRVVRCRACHLVYVNPQNTKDRLIQIYDHEYFQNPAKVYYKDYYAERDFRSREFAKMIKRIETFKKPGRLLDVGAAAGFLMDSARKSGWETYGVEFSKTASEFARGELKLNVKTGELPECDWPEDYFDVITMIDMIEHTKDPKANLRAAARFLKPGGLLVISTPNIASLGFRIFGKGFVFMRPEVHLWYFDLKTMSRMLASFGIRVLKADYPYFDTRYFNGREVWNLISRISRKIRVGEREAVPSAPMPGNLMNLFCEKTNHRGR